MHEAENKILEYWAVRLFRLIVCAGLSVPRAGPKTGLMYVLFFISSYGVQNWFCFFQQVVW